MNVIMRLSILILLFYCNKSDAVRGNNSNKCFDLYSSSGQCQISCSKKCGTHFECTNEVGTNDVICHRCNCLRGPISNNDKTPVVTKRPTQAPRICEYEGACDFNGFEGFRHTTEAMRCCANRKYKEYKVNSYVCYYCIDGQGSSPGYTWDQN